MESGEVLIAKERQEQLSKHNWTAEHDDAHDQSELAQAAVAVLILDVNVADSLLDPYPGAVWPWKVDPWFWNIEKKDRIGQLVVAGALIAAEIDRLQRLNQPNSPTS